MRLFAALPLPEAALERLTSLRLRHSTPKDGLRWSELTQWHITLQFYGDVDEQRASCLEDALRGIVSPAPAIQLERLDSFAAKGILFAAVTASSSLVALQAEVLQRSESCGVKAEVRPFRPHVTLARSKGKTGNLTLRKLSTPQLPPFGPSVRWTAKECLLLESTLRPQGAVYTVRARVPLHSPQTTEEGS